MNLKASYFAGSECYSFALPADEIEALESSITNSSGELEIVFDVEEFGVSTPVEKTQLEKALDSLSNFISNSPLNQRCKLQTMLDGLKEFIQKTENENIIKIIG